MATENIRAAKRLAGTPVIPGDKSISHRALIFGALAKGTTSIAGLLDSDDVNSTARCLRQMGVHIRRDGERAFVEGLDGFHLKRPTAALDCGNSGTTIRLLMGVLAAHPFACTLTGDASLIKRPMHRVAEPLTQMGAQLQLTDGRLAPVHMTGGPLRGISFALKIASAQVKTAILLAALAAEGKTTLSGEIHSRDHSERMLRHFAVDLHSDADHIWLEGGQHLQARPIRIPGDPSTAAFWMGAACLVSDAKVEMHDVSLNPSRLGFFQVLKRMGASVTSLITETDPEPMGTIRAASSSLRGVHVKADEIASLIDELPLLAILATQATGTTVIEGAEELRVKESDRIEAVAVNLRAMGAQIETRKDGFVIEGPQRLQGAHIRSFHDHRIAMAFSIAGLVAEGETVIQDAECAGISYPGFYPTLRALCR